MPTITGGPLGLVATALGTLTFDADGSAQCSLDGGAFAACSSPHDVGGLADGPHSFAVRATDAAGNQSLPSVPRLASLRDLSPTGVGLLVDRLVEPGVVFVLEVLTWGGTPLRLVARVVHASPCSEDRWLLGCALYRHLTPRELEDLA